MDSKPGTGSHPAKASDLAILCDLMLGSPLLLVPRLQPRLHCSVQPFGPPFDGLLRLTFTFALYLWVFCLGYSLPFYFGCHGAERT